MAKDPLSEAGLHFDELNTLRILEPDVGQKTTELKEECQDFVDSKYGYILTVTWLCTVGFKSIFNHSPFGFVHQHYR